MKNKRIRPGINALIAGTLIVSLSACHNNDYSESSSTKSAPSVDTANATDHTSVMADSMNGAPTSDTSMNEKRSGTNASTSTPTTKSTGARKKGRVTVGSMSAQTSASATPDRTGVYNMPEVQPSFPGGQNALENYINDNIEYQQSAVDNNNEGTVNVQFIVDENGRVTSAKTIGKQLGDGLDEEAVRVISKMPKWTPGKVKGKNVKTRLTIPISYKIEE